MMLYIKEVRILYILQIYIIKCNTKTKQNKVKIQKVINGSIGENDWRGKYGK